MVKAILLFYFLFLPLLKGQNKLNDQNKPYSFSDNAVMINNKLKISGTAYKKVLSDLLQISFNISSINKDYSKSIKESNNKVKKLQQQ